MMLALKATEGLDTDFKEGTADVVEGEQTDEGAQGLSIGRKGPVSDQLKLGFGGTVASGSDVVANMLNAVGEELALLQLESDSVLHENIANASKETQKSSNDCRPEKDVVNDDATAKVRGVFWVTGAEESLPFGLENAHHTSVEGRGVARAKGHHGPTVFCIVRGKESELLLVALANTDLMVASHVVQSNEAQEAVGFTKIVDGVVTTRNGTLEGQSDLVQATTRHTQAPNELLNADDVLLVRFGSKDNSGSPCAITFANPAIGFEHFKVLHDDLAFLGNIVRLLATNGRRAASVDSKFKVEDRFLDAGFVKAVPVAFDDGND
jgi:hypothetical protein